jgi:hypothetical protein
MSQATHVFRLLDLLRKVFLPLVKSMLLFLQVVS